MSDLVTRCPGCRVAFKASRAQMQAANGLVRCGACLNIFDAYQNLDKRQAAATNDAGTGSRAGAGESAGDEPEIFLDDTPDTLSAAPASVGPAGRSVADFSFFPTPTKSDTLVAAALLKSESGGRPFWLPESPDSERGADSTAIEPAPLHGGKEVPSPEKTTAIIGKNSTLPVEADNNSPGNGESSPSEDLPGESIENPGDARFDSDDEYPNPDEYTVSVQDGKSETYPQSADDSPVDPPRDNLADGRFEQLPGVDAPLQPPVLQPPDAGSVKAPPMPGFAENRAMAKGMPAWQAASTAGDITGLPTGGGRKRTARAWLWYCLAVIALVGLLAQYVYFHRDQILEDPRYRPWLENLCDHLHCQLPVFKDPTQIRAQNLTVRSHPRRQNALLVSATLINRAHFDQPFPDLILQFDDLAGKPVAIRRFAPDEYLRGELAGAVFMPVNQAVRLEIEIQDPGDQAVSYSLFVAD